MVETELLSPFLNKRVVMRTIPFARHGQCKDKQATHQHSTTTQQQWTLCGIVSIFGHNSWIMRNRDALNLTLTQTTTTVSPSFRGSLSSRSSNTGLTGTIEAFQSYYCFSYQCSYPSHLYYHCCYCYGDYFHRSYCLVIIIITALIIIILAIFITVLIIMVKITFIIPIPLAFIIITQYHRIGTEVFQSRIDKMMKSDPFGNATKVTVFPYARKQCTVQRGIFSFFSPLNPISFIKAILLVV
jgi:ABC-type multidrug transport system fused ATPase/permease subunit